MSYDNKFNLDQFRRWMRKDQKEHIVDRPPTNESDLMGTYVISKVPLTKLLEKIKCENDLEDIASEFSEDGGEIINTEEKMFEIQVPSGETFTILRYYVKRG